MSVWFLVIVLTAGDVEQHVAVEMPSESVCEDVAERYIHVAEYPTPTSLQIEEVRCEEAGHEQSA